jgi:hypothetical protein
MAVYIPAQFTGDPKDPTQLMNWLQNELGKIQAATKGKIIQLDQSNAVPPGSLSLGMIAFADGVNWNPGSGKGVYIYDGGWVLLPDSPDTDIEPYQPFGAL